MQLLKEKNTYKWVYLREWFKNLKTGIILLKVICSKV